MVSRRGISPVWLEHSGTQSSELERWRCCSARPCIFIWLVLPTSIKILSNYHFGPLKLEIAGLLGPRWIYSSFDAPYMPPYQRHCYVPILKEILHTIMYIGSIYIYIHTHIYTYIHTYTYIYIYRHMRFNMCQLHWCSHVFFLFQVAWMKSEAPPRMASGWVLAPQVSTRCVGAPGPLGRWLGPSHLPSILIPRDTPIAWQPHGNGSLTIDRVL